MRCELLHRFVAELPGVDRSILQVDHHEHSPIFSVRTRYPRELASHCQRRGFVVRAIMAPTVPRGKERVRVCLHAGNTRNEIGDLVDAITQWVKEKQGARPKL
jgi:8-amino-7-oxononanoate synthase